VNYLTLIIHRHATFFLSIAESGRLTRNTRAVGDLHISKDFVLFRFRVFVIDFFYYISVKYQTYRPKSDTIESISKDYTKASHYAVA